MIPETLLNQGTEFSLCQRELAAYPVMLKRAATTGNRRLYKALLLDLLTLVDDLENQTYTVERKLFLQGIAQGMKQ